MTKYLRAFPLEAAVWVTGLTALAFYNVSDSHFSICPFYNLGLDFCMGCGLGRSISYAFHGHLIQSLKTHPLGIFAVIVLSFRIVQLSKQYLKTLWQK